MPGLLSPIFRTLHCEEAQSSSSSGAMQNGEQQQQVQQYTIPHLPGEGRFIVSAKVRCVAGRVGGATTAT